MWYIIKDRQYSTGPGPTCTLRTIKAEGIKHERE